MPSVNIWCCERCPSGPMAIGLDSKCVDCGRPCDGYSGDEKSNTSIYDTPIYDTSIYEADGQLGACADRQRGSRKTWKAHWSCCGGSKSQPAVVGSNEKVARYFYWAIFFLVAFCPLYFLYDRYHNQPTFTDPDYFTRPGLVLHLIVITIWGTAISIFYHMNTINIYQPLFVLAAAPPFMMLSYSLWGNARDVGLVGLPCGISVGLVVSALAYKCWFGDEEAVMGHRLEEENECRGLTDEKANSYV